MKPSPHAMTFDNLAELLTYLGLRETEAEQLGVLLERFTPGRPLDLASIALLRGQAKFVRDNRPEPPALPEYPRDLRLYRSGL